MIGAEFPTIAGVPVRSRRALDHPDRATAISAALQKVRRKGPIFVDYLRNQRGAPAARPSRPDRAATPAAQPLGAWYGIGAECRSDNTRSAAEFGST